MGRHLGIDYGEKRIGVAVSDPLNIIAQGVTVVANDAGCVVEIDRISQKFGASTIVVGRPTTLAGKRGAKVVEVEHFVVRLAQGTHAAIIQWDERLTSQIAQRTLLSMGVKRKKRQVKSTVDEMAAAIILQSYLDHLNHRQSLRREGDRDEP